MRRFAQLQLIALVGVYFVASRLGLALADAHGNVSSIWPPTGIAIAALLIFGTRLWPGIAIGALLASLSTGAPILAAGGIAAGNTLEALCAVTLLRRAGFENALERVRDVARPGCPGRHTESDRQRDGRCLQPVSHGLGDLGPVVAALARVVGGRCIRGADRHARAAHLVRAPPDSSRPERDRSRAARWRLRCW